MKKNKGFTLVELVIVIVILGILAVTAAPRFLNLGGDARAGTLEAVRGSLESAGAMVFSKAILQGVENDAVETVTNPNVDVVFGYPAATVAALTAVLELDGDQWTVSDNASATATPAGTAAITPEGILYTATVADACQVLYAVATDNTRPVITVQAAGC